MAAMRTGQGSPLWEIQRLRNLCAEADRQRDQAIANLGEAQAQLAELREMTSRYVQIMDDRTESLDHIELDAYQRGYSKCQEDVDRAHMEGTAHDKCGRMHLMPMPKEVPEIPSDEQRVVNADEYTRAEGEWWDKEFGRREADQRRQQQAQADRTELRQMRARQHGGGEREAAG